MNFAGNYVAVQWGMSRCTRKLASSSIFALFLHRSYLLVQLIVFYGQYIVRQWEVSKCVGADYFWYWSEEVASDKTSLPVSAWRRSSLGFCLDYDCKSRIYSLHPHNLNDSTCVFSRCICPSLKLSFWHEESYSAESMEGQSFKL